MRYFKTGIQVEQKSSTENEEELIGQAQKKPANELAFNQSLYLTGNQWDSNPRPSEPQSDVLTN
jgi:hypothetical protein